MQTTALVNEAYLRLVRLRKVDSKNRAHFYFVAARAMRRILVDHFRKRRSEKRGGKWIRVPLPTDKPDVGRLHPDIILALDEALSRLEERMPEKAMVLELRYFAGMKDDEIAEILGKATRTIRRWREYALAILGEMMQEGSS